MNKKRIEEIDILKGIGMVAVVLIVIELITIIVDVLIIQILIIKIKASMEMNVLLEMMEIIITVILIAQLRNQ